MKTARKMVILAHSLVIIVSGVLAHISNGINLGVYNLSYDKWHGYATAGLASVVLSWAVSHIMIAFTQNELTGAWKRLLSHIVLIALTLFLFFLVSELSLLLLRKGVRVPAEVKRFFLIFIFSIDVRCHL